MTRPEDLTALADRAAINDVVLRYFELIDQKAWDRFDEVFTEDTTARWTAEVVVQGRDRIVDAARHMIGSDEIVTYHHVAAMAPVVDGDTAEVTVRARAMHSGLGPREGKSYESFGVQPTCLVRTADGWRISHHEWRIIVKQGDMEDLFAPEIAAGRRH
jgi:ketosteroid isomerase-like protein